MSTTKNTLSQVLALVRFGNEVDLDIGENPLVIRNSSAEPLSTDHSSELIDLRFGFGPSDELFITNNARGECVEHQVYLPTTAPEEVPTVGFFVRFPEVLAKWEEEFGDGSDDV